MEASAAPVRTRPPRRPAIPEPPLGAPAAYAAEFIGTFMLVFAIVFAVANAEPLGLLGIGLVHIFALTLAIHTLGGVSGGHFNPAVTIALLAVRRISSNHAIAYMIAQILGGLLACLIALILIKDPAEASNYAAGVVFDEGPLAGAEWKGLVAEMIGTFFLMWAIMGTAINAKGVAGWAPWVIGGSLGLMVYVFGPSTNGSFNPARAIAPAIFGGEMGPLWLYIVGPIIGAAAAAVTYSILVLEPQDRAERADR